MVAGSLLVSNVKKLIYTLFRDFICSFIKCLYRTAKNCNERICKHKGIFKLSVIHKVMIVGQIGLLT